MNNVIRLDEWWKGKQPPPPSGPTEPPPMDISERVTKIETTLPTLATREGLSELRTEMHREFTTQTWRIITWFTGVSVALVSAVYFIARHTS